MFVQFVQRAKDAIKDTVTLLSQDPVPRSLDNFLSALKKEDLENSNINKFISSVHLAIGFKLERQDHIERIDRLAAIITEEKPYLTNTINYLTATIHSAYPSRLPTPSRS